MHIRTSAIVLIACVLLGCGQGYNGTRTQTAATTAAISAPLSVCMVGDSITARGFVWRDDMELQRPGWHFSGSHFDGTYMHDGVGGDTTRDILLRLDAVPSCDVYLLLAGGNDLAKKTATPQRIAKNLQIIADTLAARGGQVYLMNLIPCQCGADGNLAIIYTNYMIRQSFHGYKTLDAWNAMMASPYPSKLLYADHFHPSWLGYRELAHLIETSIAG